MIIGKVYENEPRIKFQIELYCNSCKKKVPGGLQASKKYYQTPEFNVELDDFKKNYLCGICRDKKRTKIK